MKYKSFKKDIIGEIQKKEKIALEAIGQYVTGEAKVRTPVDTGLLRSSNDYRTQESSVTVGNHAEYSKFVEKGTRFQKKQPFLEPSVMENRNNIKKIVEDILKE